MNLGIFPRLKLLSTLVTEYGFGNIFTGAFWTNYRLWFFFYGMPAAGAELRVGRQVFTAFCTLPEDQLLMTAEWTEFCVLPDGMAAIRT